MFVGLVWFNVTDKTRERDFFVVGHGGDGDENEGVGAFGSFVPLRKTSDFMCEGIMPSFAVLSFDRASDELFDPSFLASDRV